MVAELITIYKIRIDQDYKLDFGYKLDLKKSIPFEKNVQVVLSTRKDETTERRFNREKSIFH